MINAYLDMFRKYAKFSGTTSRSDFWYAILMNFIVSFVLGLITGLIRMPWIASIYGLAIFIPSLALAVRRLHDTGKSGWYLFMGLIPCAGVIILIVQYCQLGITDNNPYREV